MATRKPKLSLSNLSSESGTGIKATVLDTLKLVEGQGDESKTNTIEEPRTYKRVAFNKLRSSQLNDYPIENIPEMEKLLLTKGLLEPFGVSYLEEEDLYEIESGDRRFHALGNLFSKYESGDTLSDEDEKNRELYIQNLHGLYVNGIYCMLENGPQDEASKRSRIIIHNESSRPFDPIRTASRLNELSQIYTDQNKLLPKEQRFNVNEKIAEELKGKYSVRQIIRYKNFDGLIDELKDVIISHDMSISEISTYHTLSTEEQLALSKYITDCFANGLPVELPSKEEIKLAVQDAANEMALDDSNGLQDDNNTQTLETPDDTSAIQPVEEKSSSIDDIKAKAAQKIIAGKNKKETKIKDTMSVIQKKSEQLEKAVYSFIAETDDDTKLDIKSIINDIDSVLSKLTEIKDSLRQ